MPRRTNDFQKLVTLVQKALAPKGAKVTESFLMELPGTGEAREIDVLIETSVGPYRIKIAVEAKDHYRKMDSTQFEAILGKYSEGGVKVDKIVVVTSSGFYQPVIERARNWVLISSSSNKLKELNGTNWCLHVPLLRTHFIFVVWMSWEHKHCQCPQVQFVKAKFAVLTVSRTETCCSSHTSNSTPEQSRTD